MKKFRAALLIAATVAALLTSCGRKPESAGNTTAPTAAATPATTPTATPTTAIIPETTPTATPTEPADITPSVTPDPTITPEQTPIPSHIPSLPPEFTTEESLRKMIDDIATGARYSYVETLFYSSPSNAEMTFQLSSDTVLFTRSVRYINSDFVTLMEQYLYDDDVVFTIVYCPYGSIIDNGVEITYDYAVYVFNEQNQCLASCYEPNNGNYYTYNDSGKLTATATYEEGKLNSYSLHEYDERGRLIKETLYDPADSTDFRELFQYTYDESNNIIAKTYKSNGEGPTGWFCSSECNLDDTPGEYRYEYHKDIDNRLTGWTAVRDDGSGSETTVEYKVCYYSDGIVAIYRENATDKDPDGIVFRATGELEEMLLGTSGLVAQYEPQKLYFMISGHCTEPEATLYRTSTLVMHGNAQQQFFNVPRTFVSDECSKMLYYGKLPRQLLDTDTFDHDLLAQYAAEHPTDFHAYRVYDGERLVSDFDGLYDDSTRRSYQYDSEGRLTSLIEATLTEQTDFRFRYDEEGRLTERICINNRALYAIEIGFDRSVLSETCQFKYDSEGELKSITIQTSTTVTNSKTGETSILHETRSVIDAVEGVIPPINPSM